jgi:4-aminobutyrate--pyruvate transaminase
MHAAHPCTARWSLAPPQIAVYTAIIPTAFAPECRPPEVSVMDDKPNSQAARDIAYYFHPATNARRHEDIGPTIMERGKGVHVYDDQGKEYIEGLAGLWSVAVGFGEERLVRAATRQMSKLPYYHSFNHKSHPVAIDLAERLVKMAPKGLTKAQFTSSGSEAIDFVIKLLWYYNNAVGRPQKKKFISRQRAYHGVTIAAASLTGLPANQRDFDLPLPMMKHVSFIGEPVMGAGGVILPPKGYWEKIQAVCRKHDVMLIADEVICGFGRTGKMFACELYGIKPDILVLSKAITSSYMPLSAVLVTDEIYQAVADNSAKIGTFGHGFTASGHPVATAVAMENLDIIEERDLVGHAARVSPRFLKRLHAFASRPLVGETRGVGLIGAIEFVANKETKAPFVKPGSVGMRLQDLAQEEGLVIRSIGDMMAFCPPLIITEAEIDEMFTRFDRAMTRLESEMGGTSEMAAE